MKVMVKMGGLWCGGDGQDGRVMVWRYGGDGDGQNGPEGHANLRCKCLKQYVCSMQLLYNMSYT